MKDFFCCWRRHAENHRCQAVFSTIKTSSETCDEATTQSDKLIKVICLLPYVLFRPSIQKTLSLMRYFRRVWASHKALVAPRALVNQVLPCILINRKKIGFNAHKKILTHIFLEIRVKRTGVPDLGQKPIF